MPFALADSALGFLTITPREITVRGRHGFVNLCPERVGGGFGIRIRTPGAPW